WLRLDRNGRHQETELRCVWIAPQTGYAKARNGSARCIGHATPGRNGGDCRLESRRPRTERFQQKATARLQRRVCKHESIAAIRRRSARQHTRRVSENGQPALSDTKSGATNQSGCESP